MDSKQLESLGQYRSAEARKLTFTDAYELMSKKILINRMSIENMKLQIEYGNLSKKLQELNIATCNEKIKLVEQLNGILEQQLNEFTELRQNECLDIYGYINELDSPTTEFIQTCDKLETARAKMEDLMEKIQKIENTIPNEQVITNYTVRDKLPENPIGTCQTEATAYPDIAPE
jgi:hypothetical protein